MPARSLWLSLATPCLLVPSAACDDSAADAPPSRPNDRPSQTLVSVDTSSEVLQTGVFTASLELRDLTLQVANEQLSWLNMTLESDARPLAEPFRDGVGNWNEVWETVIATYRPYPVTSDLEAIARTMAVSGATFGELTLASSFLARYFQVPDFLRVAAEVQSVRLDWLGLDSLVLAEWARQDQMVSRRFPELEDLDLLTTNSDQFAGWLRELDSSQSLLTRSVATPAQERELYSERKGRLARLRDDIIPFWRDLAERGLQPDSEEALSLLVPLTQLTEDYAEARQHLGRYLERLPAFSYEYSLLVQWGLNDLFCRSVYMGVLTGDTAWLSVATKILEVQLLSAGAMISLLSSVSG